VPVAVGEPEGPVVNLLLGAVPVVGPGEDERASAHTSEGAVEPPSNCICMRELAVAHAVETEFAHHHGTIAGKRVKPREVCLEVLPRLEVHVEREEVEER